MATKRLKLKDLVATTKMQTRVELNQEALADYKEHAKLAKAKGANPSFPPLVVFVNPLDPEEKHYLSSGFTRRVALLAAGFDEYEAEVRDSEDPKRDALKFGFTANREHGARLTNADKKHNLVLALEDPEWAQLSGNALADMLGVSEGFIRQNRPVAKKPAKVKTKAGKQVDTSNIGKKGGSARKKAAAAKKPGKQPAGAAGGSSPGADGADGADGGGTGGDDTGPKQPKPDIELEKAKAKIAKAIDGHGFRADEFITAVTEGTLPLSAPDIKKMASKSEDRIRLLAPLVINQRWGVGKAIAFIDKEPQPDTRADHFMNLAVAHGGLVQERVGDFKCVWLRADDFTIGETPEGVITITPKAKGKKKAGK